MGYDGGFQGHGRLPGTQSIGNFGVNVDESIFVEGSGQ